LNQEALCLSAGVQRNVARKSFEQFEQCQARHDRRRVVLLIVSIALGPTLPFPMNVIQMVLCGLSMAARIAAPDKTPHKTASSSANLEMDRETVAGKIPLA
jgi:hypothetical protein